MLTSGTEKALSGALLAVGGVKLQAGRAGAQVAELVDAQVSGTCGRKVVEVRVFSWAPVEQIPIQLGWANLSHFF